MLDIIAALVLGAMFATDVIVLVGLAAIPQRTKVWAFTAAVAWAATIVTIAASGGFRPGVIGPIPAPVVPFAIVPIVATIAWAFSPVFRRALLSVPLAALIGVNAFRIGGVFFLILLAEGRLPAPFAPSAGWGDVITGIAAIPIAARLASGWGVSRHIVTTWNVFGALDLVVAVTLAFLSAPGTPYRVFRDAPGTVVMTALPWIGVATLLVPLYLLTHFTIAVQMREARTERSALRTGGAAMWRSA